MKTSPISAIVAILFFIIVFALAFVYFNQPAASAQGAAGLALQTTPTPPAEEDVSVIGSTDGILIMGIVIVLIVTLPLLFRKKGK